MEVERYRNLARASLSETAFQAEQAAGFGMSLEQAIEYAYSLTPEPGAAAPDEAYASRLTGRECEVVALIGQGKTNSVIAAELVLSKRTVETHVSNILSKLELSHRAQIMRWALEHEQGKSVK
jgi:non-specific serine/threonine protein kinase